MTYDLYWLGSDVRGGRRRSGHGVLHLTVLAMATWREALVELGAIRDASPEHCPRPWPSSGAGDDHLELRSWRPRADLEARTVPRWKYCSNDDWIVTPAECADLVGHLLPDWPRTLAVLHAAFGGTSGQHWWRWLRFHTGAQRAGGYRVA